MRFSSKIDPESSTFHIETLSECERNSEISEGVVSFEVSKNRDEDMQKLEWRFSARIMD